MRLFIGVALLSLSSIALGQNDYPKVSFEMGYNIQHTKMQKFNQYFIDSNFIKYSDINTPFKKLNDFNITFKIRPKPIVDIGLALGLLQGIKEGRPVLKTIDEDLNLIFKEGYRKLTLRSYSIGIKNTWYINRFFKLQEEKNILNKFDFGMDLLLGYALTTVNNEVHNTLKEPVGVNTAEWFTNDFYGKLGVNIEYMLFSKSLYCSVGFKTGYQFHKTKTMTDRLDVDYIKMPYNVPINLDFSGFYYGLYLKLGK